MGSLCVPTQPLNYPLARRDDSVVDTYHGVVIPDPYQWLENPDSEETKEFVRKQSELTDSVLKSCETRDKLREKLTQLFDFPKYDVPFRAGDNNYFYFHNTGLQPQRVLYVQDCLDAKAEVLLDPNRLSEDGSVALKIWGVSQDAKYLAYGISSRGSDWVTVRVMTVHDKAVQPDILSWVCILYSITSHIIYYRIYILLCLLNSRSRLQVKFSDVSWTKDSKGFFYSRYPAPK
nr:prolyl endopeptidase-like [Ipomoea batatas]